MAHPVRSSYKFGPFLLDMDQRVLLRDGLIVPLTPKSFDTLLALVESGGRILDKEELLKKVWPDTFVEEVNLAKNISILRKVFEEDSGHRYIETIPRRGYRFVSAIEEVPAFSEDVASPNGMAVGKNNDQSAIGESAGYMEDALSLGTSRPIPARGRPSAALWMASLAVLCVAALITIAILLFRPFSKAPPPADAVPLTSFPGEQSQAAFSPDGKQIAFIWDGADHKSYNVYVKMVGAETVLRLTTSPANDSKPVWSPDGRSIVFLRVSGDEDSAYYSVPALGGPERKLADVSPHADIGTGNSSYYSPDGKYLAVADRSSPSAPASIFLLSLESGQKRQLTSPPAGTIGDYCPAFSPAGKMLAFIRSTSLATTDVYVLRLPDGTPKQLTFDDFTVQGLAWTANSAEIIFASRRGGNIGYLWRISADGGTPAKIATIGKEVLSPAISAQANRLAYTQLSDDTNIWRIDLDASGKGTSQTEVIGSTFWDGDPDNSPDGQKIAFASGRSGGFGIWVSNSDGSSPWLLFDGGPYLTGTPRWSPDGRQIAFDSRSGTPGTGGNPDIVVISAEGGHARQLTTDPAEDVAPSWSRDGHWIYFGSTRSGSMQIWKVPANGGPAMQVTRQGGFEGFESSDQKYLYYLKGRGIPGIWRTPTAGGPETPVITDKQAGRWRYWRVVDRGIYFATRADGYPSVEFFDFATGQLNEVFRPAKRPEMYMPGMAIAPDGHSLLYTQKDQSGSNIMMIEDFR